MDRISVIISVSYLSFIPSVLFFYVCLYSHHISLERATLSQVLEFSVLKGQKRKLFYKEKSVAVVYFRAGYTPTDYPFEKVFLGFFFQNYF